MSLALMLQGILPLLVFAVVDIFASMRTALICAMVFAIAEACWGYYSFGEVDQLTWVSMGLVLAMGTISYYMKNDKLFKFQPVVLGLVTAGTLAYFQFKGNPLLVQMIPKILPLLPDNQKELVQNPNTLLLMARLDALLIGMFLIHAALVAWAAMYKTTLVWLLVRGVGLYVLLALTLLVHLLLGPPAA